MMPTPHTNFLRRSIMAEKKTVSKAQQRSVNKYVKENYDRINVTLPKGKKEIIKAHAESMGESVNDSSAARSITRSSATKASGSKPVPAPGLTGTRHGIIITHGSVFDTPPPLIGGGVRVCFFLRSPALSLTSAALPFIMNTWKHSRPPLIGGRVKCFLFLCPPPCCIEQGE